MMTSSRTPSRRASTVAAVVLWDLALAAVLLVAVFSRAEGTRVKVRPFKFTCELKGLSVRQFRSPRLRRDFCRAYTSFIGIDVKVSTSQYRSSSVEYIQTLDPAPR